jgi:4'-phosphopantetheinyl transferase
MGGDRLHKVIFQDVIPLPKMLELGKDEVHVWDIPIAPVHLTGELEVMLSSDEYYRAKKYKSEDKQMQFIATRAKLRQLLGRYLDIPPVSLRFSYSARGKPMLINRPDLSFNISHSGCRALIAVGKSRQIGVDIELVRPLPDFLDIAQRFFSSEETADLMSIGDAGRELAFYTCWTRKEAFIKCIGDGLSTPLDSFQVTLHPDQPARILKVKGYEEPDHHWTLRDLSFDAEYAAAMVYSGKHAKVQLFSSKDTEQTLLV